MLKLHSWFAAALLVPALAFAPGCGSSDNPTTTTDTTSTPSVTPTVACTLALIHAADMEGNAESVDEAPRFSALWQKLAMDYPMEYVKLSSGDNYIPSPWFDAQDDASLNSTAVGTTDLGRADIQIMNELGIQASALGNHEFDKSTGALAGLIEGEDAYSGALFPYLSCNLDFAPDANLNKLLAMPGVSAPTAINSIASSVIVESPNGEKFGVIGATTPRLEEISSTGDVVVLPISDSTATLAAFIQVEVERLIALGMSKIILLAHMQNYAIELELATLLSGVDVIVAGGSDAIFADSNDRLRAGDTASETYPVWRTSATGEPVAIVNTDGQYRYVGRLVIGFDADGVIIESSVDDTVSGCYATDAQGITDAGSPSADAEVQAISDAIRTILIAREGKLFGASSVFLNGDRSPGVRTEETNLGNLTADSLLAYSQDADASVALAIKNGGGIRANVGRIEVLAGDTEASKLPTAAVPVAGKQEGDISQLDIQRALAFNNGLTLLTVTATELVALLEHGLGDWPNVAGRFPQIAGMRVSFDGNASTGSRVVNLAVLDSNGAANGGGEDEVVVNGVIQGDASRTFRIVTLSFLASGGDGYPFPSTNRVDLETAAQNGTATFADDGTEQDALAEYLLANFPRTSPFSGADTEANADKRIVNTAVAGSVDDVLTNP